MTAANNHHLDLLALGEVMLRLDPGEGRIRTARSFDAYIGGGEFNVAAGLSSCFGMRSGIVTALADNEVGRLILSMIQATGVDTRFLDWQADGGTGTLGRNGLNFTERGFGLRPPYGVSDRANSAASLMSPGDIRWPELLHDTQTRWLHTGGVFSALSDNTAELALEAVEAAQYAGVTVSYDVNFRASLFNALTDQPRHSALVKRILQNVDVLISNEPEFRLSIGEELLSDDVSSEERFRRFVFDARKRFPGIKVFAATQRSMTSTTTNDWGAIAWSATTGFVHARPILGLEVFDRIGGGDAFVAGLAYSLLSGYPLDRALDVGVAHGALLMTTPGDTSSASLDEVMNLANGAPIVTIR